MPLLINNMSVSLPVRNRVMLLLACWVYAVAQAAPEPSQLAAEKQKGRELVERARAGDRSAFDEIATLSPEVAIPILQPTAFDGMSEGSRQRASEAIRKVQGAVPYLAELIKERITYKALDPRISDAFKTLAVIGTNEAIAVVAPHLLDKTVLRSGMDDVANWRVDGLAARALVSMKLPDAPKPVLEGSFTAQDSDAWREWWKKNHKKYGATEVPPITETDPADLERYARARATPTPGPDDVVNLARVTDAKVIASRINGDRKQDDVYFGVLNAFDGGTHFFRNTSYSTWGADPRDEDPWIQVCFSKPVTITGLVVEPAIPKFRAEIFGEKEKLREIEGKGAVELPTPLKDVSRVRLHFDTFMKEGMPMVIQEIKVMGYTPDGRKGTALTPNLDLSPSTGKPAQ